MNHEDIKTEVEKALEILGDIPNAPWMKPNEIDDTIQEAYDVLDDLLTVLKVVTGA